MVFSSLIFINVFIPVLCIVYFFTRDSYRNYVLLAFSLFFYAWGEPKYIAVMIFSIIINYIVGCCLDGKIKPSIRKIVLFVGITLDLSILIYFKYMNFFIENLNNVFGFSIDTLNFLMPIGISFFTFQAISYIVDVYREEVEPQRNIYKVALYISFFPQLIAGPIIKYHDIEQELSSRTHTMDKFIYGIYKFIVGLSKKVIIANQLGMIVDQIYATELEYLSPQVVWIGSICYSLQLYFDFSGYSDMAIGLGRIFGFKFMENFNYPYISRSITEFWRRWHISLSTWFREYLYIPLGGNRRGKVFTYINLFIVFFATGLWHGASWSFVIWGLYNGFFIVLERLTRYKVDDKNFIRRIFKLGYTLFVVNIGWVLFRSEDLSYAIGYIKRMLYIDTDFTELFAAKYYLTNTALIVLGLGIICSTPIFKRLFDPLLAKNKIHEALSYVLLTAMFILCISYLVNATYNPFIYFRF